MKKIKIFFQKVWSWLVHHLNIFGYADTPEYIELIRKYDPNLPDEEKRLGDMQTIANDFNVVGNDLNIAFKKLKVEETKELTQKINDFAVEWQKETPENREIKTIDNIIHFYQNNKEFCSLIHIPPEKVNLTIEKMHHCYVSSFIDDLKKNNFQVNFFDPK